MLLVFYRFLCCLRQSRRRSWFGEWVGGRHLAHFDKACCLRWPDFRHCPGVLLKLVTLAGWGLPGVVVLRRISTESAWRSCIEMSLLQIVGAAQVCGAQSCRCVPRGDVDSHSADRSLNHWSFIKNSWKHKACKREPSVLVWRAGTTSIIERDQTESVTH